MRSLPAKYDRPAVQKGRQRDTEKVRGFCVSFSDEGLIMGVMREQATSPPHPNPLPRNGGEGEKTGCGSAALGFICGFSSWPSRQREGGRSHPPSRSSCTSPTSVLEFTELSKSANRQDGGGRINQSGQRHGAGSRSGKGRAWSWLQGCTRHTPDRGRAANRP